MGYAFYFPLVFFIVFFIQYVMGEKELSFFLLTQMEFLIAPFSAWWVIFLYFDYFEEDGRDLFYSYPVTALEHGLFRVSIFCFIYFLFILICCAALTFRFPDANFFVLLLQYLSESIFYISVAFLFIICFKKVTIPIVIIGSYVSTEYLTGGQIIPLFHVMFFNDSPLAFDEVILSSTINLVLSIVCTVIGHLLLAKQSQLKVFKNNKFYI
ncbi:hypothetical protein ACH0B5_14445 [Ureibacillus sp. 179-F W5.1 NHS]|nr:hypothetical protein [Lysinibacillus halotolerans]